MIKTIAFDIGGVLVSSLGTDITDYAGSVLGIDKNLLRELYAKYTPGLQKGTYDDIQFWKHILKEIDVAPPADEVLATFLRQPYEEKVTLNTDMLVLIRELKKHYIVGCITNTQEAHVNVKVKQGLYEEFSPRILSHRVQMIKPDKEIFELYLQEAGCEPQEMVFIDDQPKHFVNAEKMGIHCIPFTDIENLKKELKKLGVQF